MSERLFLTIALTISLILLATNIPTQSPTLRSLLKLASVKLEHAYYRL